MLFVKGIVHNRLEQFFRVMVMVGPNRLNLGNLNSKEPTNDRALFALFRDLVEGIWETRNGKEGRYNLMTI